MADIAFEKDLSAAETGIEGLKVVDLAVHGDSRGWFKENWQRAKMTALGIVSGKRAILIPSRRQNAPRANSRYAIHADSFSDDTILFGIYLDRRSPLVP